MDCTEFRQRLAVWLDGELTAAEGLLVQRHLAACSTCEARARGEGRVRQRIAEVLAAEPLPAGLADRMRSLVQTGVPAPGQVWLPARTAARFRADVRRRPRAWLRGAGLAMAAALAGLLLARTVGRDPLVTEGLAAALAQDHLHHGASGHEFLLQERDPARLGRWFSRAAGLPVSVPPPPAAGRLVGGQLCRVDGRDVPHVVYVIDGGALSWFLVPGADGPARLREGRVAPNLRYATWDAPAGAAYVLTSAEGADLRRFPGR